MYSSNEVDDCGFMETSPVKEWANSYAHSLTGDVTGIHLNNNTDGIGDGVLGTIIVSETNRNNRMGTF